MPLSQSQKSLVEKVRNVGGSDIAVPLDDAACSYLLARLAHDLNLAGQHPEVEGPISPFFETMPVSSLRLEGVEFLPLAERLFASMPDADTYFSCLAALHKARLKFERILQRQPFSTMEQIGHRGLLQFGSMSPTSLVAFLAWRKWLYDTDNRAAQGTGYLFEPILAAASRWLWSEPRVTAHKKTTGRRRTTLTTRCQAHSWKQWPPKPRLVKRRGLSIAHE